MLLVISTLVSGMIQILIDLGISSSTFKKYLKFQGCCNNAVVLQVCRSADQGLSWYTEYQKGVSSPCLPLTMNNTIKNFVLFVVVFLYA